MAAVVIEKGGVGKFETVCNRELLTKLKAILFQENNYDCG